MKEHRLWLTFTNLPNGRSVLLEILRSNEAEWTTGTVEEVPVGLSITSDPSVGVFALQRFAITHKTIEFVPSDEINTLVVRLFVATSSDIVRGVAFLPDGVKLSVESTCDTTTVTGQGSWYISLARPT